jgi:L-threonylcarbamoyladenylate synthase
LISVSIVICKNKYKSWWPGLAAGGENSNVKTLRISIDANHLETQESRDLLDRAARILRDGGLVALPTETVYGLGANALDRAAVEKIFAAKSRPAWDPVIVHVASRAMLEGLVEAIPDGARRLMEAFWPGPLTLLLTRQQIVPEIVTAGRPLVGVRWPSHPVALELIRRAGIPVAAPSANRFGHISPTTAEHVLHDLDGRIDAVVDAGPTQRGVESTVLDPGPNPMVIYRPGAVTVEQIRHVAGPVELYRGEKMLGKTPAKALPSPGVGVRHYAPRARLVLIEAADEEIGQCLADAASAERGERLGVMLPAGIGPVRDLAAAQVYPWGNWEAPETLAQALYTGLRALDSAKCTVILCPLPHAEGIGVAIRDRLKKAGVRIQVSEVSN